MQIKPTLEDDQKFLRAAIAQSDKTGQRGNRPFGAVLVYNNEIIAEDVSTQHETGDITDHAELRLVSQASRKFDRATLAESTLYSSSEPCPMCSGSIYWAGIRRLVYGCSQKRIGELESEKFAVPTRDVLTRGGHPVEIVWPMLEDEAFEVLQRYLGAGRRKF